jgi:hypothetical protein
VLGQGNIGWGFLDIHHKEQHQECLYRLATARLRKNNIDALLQLHICVRAPLQLSHRGVLGVLGFGVVANGGAPEYVVQVIIFPLFLRPNEVAQF